MFDLWNNCLGLANEIALEKEKKGIKKRNRATFSRKEIKRQRTLSAINHSLDQSPPQVMPAQPFSQFGGHRKQTLLNLKQFKHSIDFRIFSNAICDRQTN